MKRSALICLTLCLLGGCDEASEPSRVALPVVTDSQGLAVVTTDLGYEITLDTAQIALGDLVFTIAGEAHTASLWDRLSFSPIACAHAHPGHYQSGDVTGELQGDFVVDWIAGTTLGEATLLPGEYTAANFIFERGQSGELAGHTARLGGTAEKDGQTIHFSVVIDSPEDRQLVGAPFEIELGGSASGRILFRFSPLDPLEEDTLFDEVDFAALDTDGDGEVQILPDVVEVEAAYNLIRRTFQTHDHYELIYED